MVVMVNRTKYTVVESFMNQWLNMDDVGIHIDLNQYGNHKKTSTSHYLIKLMDTLHKQVDKPSGSSTLVVTDFSKAFDRIGRNVLIHKLVDIGVRPPVIEWFSSFLTQRSQCVRYKGKTSPLDNADGRPSARNSVWTVRIPYNDQ